MQAKGYVDVGIDDQGLLGGSAGVHRRSRGCIAAGGGEKTQRNQCSNAGQGKSQHRVRRPVNLMSEQRPMARRPFLF